VLSVASLQWFAALPPELAAFARSLRLDPNNLGFEDFVRLVGKGLHATQLVRNEDGSLFRGEDGKTIRVPDYPVKLAAVKMGFGLYALLQDRPGKPN
jgi:hypothetical protein